MLKMLKPADSIVDIALKYVRDNNFRKAYEVLDRALQENYEDATIDFLLKSLLFWKERITKIATFSNSLESAQFLISEQKTFKTFAARNKYDLSEYDRYIFAVRRSIYAITIKLLHNALNDPLKQESEIYLQLARCYAGVGDYDKAIYNYRKVLNLSKENATAYAELGDCYVVTGNITIGKLFLREGFFISASGINIHMLDSKLMKNIIEKMKKNQDIPEEYFAQWIPVYAVIWDIFTAKRELKTVEYGKLRQKIYALEREYSESQSAELEPILLNAYFYLIDYYRLMNSEQKSIDDTLMKIKGINPSIYSQYTEKKGK